MRVNEMWFLEPGGEPLTFREVFLKSRALENIIAGMAGPQLHAHQQPQLFVCTKTSTC